MAPSGGLFAGYTFLLPKRNDTRWSPDDHDRLYGLIMEHRGNISTQLPTHILVIIDITGSSTWFRRSLQAGQWKGVPVLEVGWAWACWRAGRVLGQEENWGGYRLDPDRPVFIKAPLAPLRMRSNDQRARSPQPRNREEGRSGEADCWRPPSDWDSPMSRLSTSMSDDNRPWVNRDAPRSRAASPVRPVRSKERPDDRRASPRPAFLRRSHSPHRWVGKDVPPRPLPPHLSSRPAPNRTASAPTSTSTSPLSAQSPEAPLVRHKLPISVYDPERDPRRRSSASNALRISITSTSLPPSSAHSPHPAPQIVTASTVASPLTAECPSISTADRPETEKTNTPTSTLTPLTTISTLSSIQSSAPSEAGSSASKEVRSKGGSAESAHIFIDTNGNPLWFAVHGTAEDQQDVIRRITQGGGLVLTENKHSRARYHVFTTDETCVIPPDAVESLAALRQIKGTRALTVSSCWIDRCLQSGRLINPESYVLQYSPTSYPVPQVCVPRKRKAETEILASRGDSGCVDASPDRSAEALNVLDVNGITEVQGEPQPVLEQQQQQQQQEPGPILSLEELDDYEYDEALLDALNSDSEEETDDDGICVIPEEEYQQSALARYAREIAELGGAVRTT